MTPAATLLTLAAAAPGHGADLTIPWLRIVMAFLFCAALAVAAILAIRYRQGGTADLRSLLQGLVRTPGAGASPQLQVEQRLRLSATSQVVVLRWDAVRYLVHVAPGGAQVLDRQPLGEDTP